MLPIMQEAYLRTEDNTEDLRAIFLKADADYSGLLSLEELHLAIRDLGADVTQEQLAEMLSDFEIERDG